MLRNGSHRETLHYAVEPPNRLREPTSLSQLYAAVPVEMCRSGIQPCTRFIKYMELLLSLVRNDLQITSKQTSLAGDTD